jgi:quercetin dioxygenase-like cupin family protein
MSISAFVDHHADRDMETVGRARGARKTVLVGAEHGAPNFDLRLFVLDPGGRIPAHKHPDIEHEQYVLEGKMTVGLDDEVHTAAAGDVLFIPAQTPHWYENQTDQPVRFLCTVPQTETYETQWLEAPLDS